jgi:hypothetical protein
MIPIAAYYASAYASLNFNLGRRAAMKRWLLPIIAVLAFALCVAFAGDFWKSKKYSTWSDEETKKLIENSPWARKVPIKYIYTAPKGGGGMPGGGFGGGMPGGGMPGGGMGGGGGFGSLNAPPPDMTPKAILRWQTALPLKQAIARARYKDLVETSEEAAKTLTREEAQYILGVIGLMGAPTSFDREVLKAGATITVGDLPPIKAVDVLTDQQGMSRNLYIAFPKVQEGAHKITEADRSVDFLLKTPNIEIKAKFSLKDMLYQGKLEL